MQLDEFLLKELDKMEVEYIHHIEEDKIFVKMEDGSVKHFNFKIELDTPCYGITNNINYLKESLIHWNEIILGDVSTYNLEEICENIKGISFTRDERNISKIKKVNGKNPFAKWKKLNFPNKKLTKYNFFRYGKERKYFSYFLYSPISIIKLLEYEYCIEKKEYESDYELGTMEFYVFKSLYDVLNKFIKKKILIFDDHHLLISLLNHFKKFDEKGTVSILNFMEINFGLLKKYEHLKGYV